MKLYVAGPMTGLPELNFPEFERVATALRAQGYEVISPHEVCPDKSMAWCDAMKRDIVVLLDCDGLVRLEGWEKSKGASLEHYIAAELGLTIYDVAELLPAASKVKEGE